MKIEYHRKIKQMFKHAVHTCQLNIFINNGVKYSLLIVSLRGFSFSEATNVHARAMHLSPLHV